MLPPIPRCSGWVVGLHIDLFEACSAFTRVAACTLALSPNRDTLIEGFSHFVTSMTAPIASGWSESPGGACTHWKARRLVTAHTRSRPSGRAGLRSVFDPSETWALQVALGADSYFG